MTGVQTCALPILLAEALLEYDELTFDEAKAVIEGRKLDRPPAFDMKNVKDSSKQANSD